MSVWEVGRKCFPNIVVWNFNFARGGLLGLFYLSIFIVFLHHQFPFVSSCCSFVPPFSFFFLLILFCPTHKFRLYFDIPHGTRLHLTISRIEVFGFGIGF
uniref:Uncharacterized protein n=1 Tax=Cacopsylla melanoneura TaxID=428564 RepID=A0A8D8ZWW7_9HEMI